MTRAIYWSFAVLHLLSNGVSPLPYHVLLISIIKTYRYLSLKIMRIKGNILSFFSKNVMINGILHDDIEIILERRRIYAP